jgi:hypothetical protein
MIPLKVGEGNFACSYSKWLFKEVKLKIQRS